MMMMRNKLLIKAPLHIAITRRFMYNYSGIINCILSSDTSKEEKVKTVADLNSFVRQDGVELTSKTLKDAYTDHLLEKDQDHMRQIALIKKEMEKR